ncbi:hypothetical protein D3C80_440340 [compost metagenome]
MVVSQRVPVYIICRLIEMGNAGTGPLLDQWWVDCTVGGSVFVDSVKAQRNADSVAAGAPSRTNAMEYHIYYEDGGHNRLNERYFKQEEAILGAAQPAKAPIPLVPTPELLPPWEV